MERFESAVECVHEGLFAGSVIVVSTVVVVVHVESAMWLEHDDGDGDDDGDNDDDGYVTIGLGRLEAALEDDGARLGCGLGAEQGEV